MIQKLVINVQGQDADTARLKEDKGLNLLCTL